MVSGGHPLLWLPYCGEAPAPAELAERWNFDPVLLLGFLIAALAWRRWGWQGRAERAWPFAGAMLVLLALFVSPLCALTSALFSARAAHHVLLVALAAPLLVWSLPAGRARLPAGVWTLLAAVVLWAWHIPALYAAALANHALYWLMQATLLASAMAFWSAVRTAVAPVAVAALLGSMVQMGLLGALLTSAGMPLYAPHAGTTLQWGLIPLEDQQLAGLVMWAPAAAFYLFAALFVAGRWLRSESRAAA